MPEHTPDGRYTVVNGRRWRATDPRAPTTSAQRRARWERGLAEPDQPTG
ncbi:hypothetical protein ACFVYA_34280 [Amycolatopsis sp. NPDC058278]